MVAESTLLRDSIGLALPPAMTRVRLAGGEEAGYATGAFVCLEKPPEVKLGPLPWQGSDDPLAVPVDEATLSDGEREAMRRCDAQLGATGGAFLEPFWMDPIAPGDDAVLTIATGPHTGNRVGHVQGGLLVGFAARAGVNAAPSSMRLSSISAWFVSPGRGKLRVRSQALHRGRNTLSFATSSRPTPARRCSNPSHNTSSRLRHDDRSRPPRSPAGHRALGPHRVGEPRRAEGRYRRRGPAPRRRARRARDGGAGRGRAPAPARPLRRGAKHGRDEARPRAARRSAPAGTTDVELALLPRPDEIVQKVGVSAFQNTRRLDSVLRNAGAMDVYVAGAFTHMVVESTARQVDSTWGIA